MSVTCPNGHLSQTLDYCDQCGARIEGAPPPQSTPAPPPASPPPASPESAAPSDPAPAAPPSDPGLAGAGAGAARCPLCQIPRVGDDRFCEGCGYDYTAPTPAAGAATTVLGAGGDPLSTAMWEAIATADREYYERVAPEGVPFPIHCPARTYLLRGDQIRVGRASNSRGIQPEIDLTGAPEDSAVSHLHCILIEQPDGSYSLVDPGSTNGTTVNDDPTPLMANIAVALADGDRIHVGAWTTITVRDLRARPHTP
jgi:FHA domain